MYNYNYETELYHHGVKGMKWGVRRAQNTAVGEKKAAYKQAKKDYDKAYKDAYNYSSVHPIGQFTNKKKSAEADRRWVDAIDKADKVNTAKSEYKQAKKDRKQQIKSTYKEMNKNATFGEKLHYNNATRKLASKYVVDKNMTVDEATKRAKNVANRNTAIFVGAYAAITVASLYAKR